MRKRVFALLLSTSASVIAGCGSGGSTPSTSSTEPDIGEANSAEENVELGSPLAGVWRTVYNDGLSASDCIDLTSYSEDYTWSRVSLNNVSAGFYVIEREATTDIRGEFSLTATSGNKLASCNESNDIPVGATTARFFDEPTADGLLIYFEEDVFAEPIATLVKDEEATAALAESPDQWLEVSTGDSVISEEAGFREAVVALRAAEEEVNKTPRTPVVAQPSGTNVASADTAPIVVPAAVVDPAPAVVPAAVVDPAPAVVPAAVVDPAPAVAPAAVVVDPAPAVVPAAVVDPAPAVVPALVVDPAPAVVPESVAIVVEEEELPSVSAALPTSTPAVAPLVSQREEFSVALRCSDCRVQETQLSWEAETSGLDKLEMFFEQRNSRVKVATLQADDHSSLRIITTTLDLSSAGGGCFEVISTAEDETTTVSPQTCFGLSRGN